MRHAVKITCIYLLSLLSSISIAQPYIYRTDGSYARLDPETLERFDLQTKKWVTCFPEILIDSYEIDNKDEWVVMQWGEDRAEAWSLTDIKDYMELSFSGQQIGKVLNLHHKLYIFSNNEDIDTGYLHVVDLSFKAEKRTMRYKNRGDANQDAFFSKNDSLIYFTTDTVFSDSGVEKTKLLTYSVANNSIISEQYLYELGYPGAEYNQICSGKKGMGIIQSFNRDTTHSYSYYCLRDFDKNISSAFIKYTGFAAPYFTTSGKYLVLFETCFVSLDGAYAFDEYMSGKVSLYESSSGNLLRELSLPSHGEVKYSELYPDEVYYACDLDSLPQVYRIKPDSLLAAKRIDGISPAAVQSGVGGFILEVTGKGFTPASKVFWNDSARKTIFVSDSLLKVKISAADVATAGDKTVRVNYDGVSSAVSDSMVFHVVNALEKPKQ
jgi:hypothetical protein